MPRRTTLEDNKEDLPENTLSDILESPLENTGHFGVIHDVFLVLSMMLSIVFSMVPPWYYLWCLHVVIYDVALVLSTLCC